jgi:DNA-binding NarL/FixJ family response regulator
MHPHLTPRQYTVLALIADGLTDDEIAAQLYIAPCTAHTHAENIRLALGARNRAHAVNLAHHAGLLAKDAA